MNKKLKILLACPRGFCAGVERAIEIVERALEKHGAPVYVRHEIVHNKRVVETLRAKGAIFVEEVADIPDGAVTVFSAHGVSEAVENQARQRHLPVIDATCPLVTRVHNEGRSHHGKGRQVLLIGHAGHPEVEGTRGRIPGGVSVVSNLDDVAALAVRDRDALAYVTQTTLSVDDTRDIIQALRARFPNIHGPDLQDICYATQNRQQAVRHLCRLVDLLLVIGAGNSSNSNRLWRIGRETGIPSHLIDDADALDARWLENVRTIGLAAGASAPEELTHELISRLGRYGDVTVEELSGVSENMHFRLPRELAP